MRGLAWLFTLMVLLMMGCAPKNGDAGQVAARTAKLYYDALLEGRYDEFVAGLDRHLGTFADYDSQLVASAKAFVRDQEASHKGITAFEVAKVQYSDSAHAADVFLDMFFADSTKEQILVPMVERDEVWLMR